MISMKCEDTGLSYMPEGLEKQIDVAAMADLLAYLNSVNMAGGPILHAAPCSGKFPACRLTRLPCAASSA